MPYDWMGRPTHKKEGTAHKRTPIQGKRASGKPSARKGPLKGRGKMGKANPPSHRG